MADKEEVPVEVFIKDGEVSTEVAAALGRRAPNKPVENIVFLREIVVAPGDRALIETWPLTFSRFVARGLIIPSSIGAHFLVHDLKVDGRSQFPEKTDGIPAERFSEKTTAPSTFEDSGMIKFEECAVGKSLSVEVQNMSSEPQRFCACYIGRFLE